MHADPDFPPVLDKVETTLAATVTYCRTAEHVPQEERNNRIVHERTRETFHRLSYQSLPETALKVPT